MYHIHDCDDREDTTMSKGSLRWATLLVGLAGCYPGYGGLEGEEGFEAGEVVFERIAEGSLAESPGRAFTFYAVDARGENYAAHIPQEELETYAELMREHARGSRGGASSAAGVEDLAVIGVDTRERVSATEAFPYRLVGRVERGCTGTLVGPRHVLTAGHCVLNRDTKEWKNTGLEVSPGQSGATFPWGTLEWEVAIVFEGWRERGERADDYALILLKEPVGESLGWASITAAEAEQVRGERIALIGFPGDMMPRHTMWRSTCEVGDAAARLAYPCDTAGGMSGGGVIGLQTLSGIPEVFGVHTTSAGSENRGTLIDETRWYLLNRLVFSETVFE